MPSDSEIQQAVQSALAHDHGVTETSRATPVMPPIQVEVTDGIVVLTGRVASLAKQRAAEAAARQVPGVRAVVNGLSLHDGRTGLAAEIPAGAAERAATVAHDVLAALDDGPPEQRPDAAPTITPGRVVLQGSIAEHGQRTVVEDTVRAVPGVHTVVNQLVSSELSAAVAATHRDAGPRTVSGVEVTADDQTVTLRGNVDSWDEREAIMQTAADAAPGSPIVDGLRVEPRG